MKDGQKTILFVCVENAGRSQMAEAYFQKYAPKGYMAISAGTRPTSNINLVVIQAMNEVGIDISKQKPKVIDEAMIKNAAKSVNMGCIDKSECPMLFVDNIIDWSIVDPKGKSIEQVRIIRDEIKRRVKEFVKDLE